MENLKQDLTFGCRTLVRHPLFTTFAVLMLAIGIGINASAWGVINALLLRPLSFPDSQRLVWIENPSRGGDGIQGLSGQATYRDWGNLNLSFEDLGVYVPSISERSGFILDGRSEPIELRAACVSGNLFNILGIQPQRGRTFTEDEGKRDGPNAVILAEGFWKRQFGANPLILGQTVRISGVLYTVVGILPESFESAFSAVFSPARGQPEIFLPFRPSPGFDNWGDLFMVVGKLKRGVAIQQAQTEFEILNHRLQTEHPERGPFGARLLALKDHVTAPFRRSVWLLAAALGAALIMACVNLSSLLLARSAARHREFLVRIALGAGRGRLLRQMLTESILLSVIGGALGLGVTWAILAAISNSHSILGPLGNSIHVDGFIFLAVTLASFLTGTTFGIAPAVILSRRDYQIKCTDRAVTQDLAASWMNDALITTEVAITFVLLACAGLLIHSYSRLIELDPGFRAERAWACRIQTYRQFASQSAMAAFYQDLLRRIRQIPGVDEATVADKLPLALNDRLKAHSKLERGRWAVTNSVLAQMVDENYFKTLSIPLLRGRGFAEDDNPFDWQSPSEQVAIVNEKMSHNLWSFIGKVVVLESMPNSLAECRIVGVVGNVRQSSLEQEPGPEIYLLGRGRGELVIRTDAPLESMASEIRKTLHQIDPQMAASEMRPLVQIVDQAVASKRLVSSLLGAFSLGSLALATIGIFGVTAYSTSRRTKEIGIRMALGSTHQAIIRLILSQGFRRIWIGGSLGLVSALALTQGLRGFLFEVSPLDPITLAGTSLLVLGSGLTASWLPARKASKIDPIIALRLE